MTGTVAVGPSDRGALPFKGLKYAAVELPERDTVGVSGAVGWMEYTLQAGGRRAA